MYGLLADLVLLLHLGVVLFVVGGLVLVVVGGLRGWHWTARPAFRLAHLGAIGFVVAQAWLGQTCPLTTLESWLRVQAGGSPYAGGFIQHGVQAVLFHDLPPAVFTALYTGFGVLVLLAWWRFPPARRPRRGTTIATPPPHP
jgi:hypothetical protein